jgi:hypothetical protein
MRKKHPYSGYHYKRDSGSTPTGMNHLHTRGPAGKQTPGGSPATTAPTATTTSASSGETAAAMTSEQTLLWKVPRPRPHTRGEDKPSKPKSRGSDRRWRRWSRRRRNLLWLPPPRHRRQRPLARPRHADKWRTPRPAPADPHSSPRGRAGTSLCAEASCWSEDKTIQEHERRPSGVRRLGRSPVQSATREEPQTCPTCAWRDSRQCGGWTAMPGPSGRRQHRRRR